MNDGDHPGCAALKPVQHPATHGHNPLSASVYHSPASLAPGTSLQPLFLVQYLFYLRQHSLYLGQPEGHLHGAIHFHGGGQLNAGLLLLTIRGVQPAEAIVSVGLERTHPQLFGEGEGLLVVGFGLLALQWLALCRNVTEEAQSIRLEATLLTLTGER
jgi:hypothetical protein